MRQREILHQQSKLVTCQCGCGEQIKEYSTSGEKARFKRFHHIKKERNPMWKGGKYKSKQGYIYERIGIGDYYAQHRLVWEISYNCCLLPWILIHHKNGIKTDNRIWNLEPVTKQTHPIYHPTPEYTRFKRGYKKLELQNKTPYSIQNQKVKEESPKARGGKIQLRNQKMCNMC